MNEFIAIHFWNSQAANQLGWALAQASVIAAAAYLLVVLGRRITPAARVHISLLGLLLMAVVPVAALSLADGWSWGQLLQKAQKDSSDLPETTHELAIAELVQGDAPSLSVWQNMLVNTSAVFTERVEPGQVASSAQSPKMPSGKGKSSWPPIVLGLLSLCVAYGLSRLLVGYWQIRRLRRDSRPVADGSLQQDLRECMRKLGIASEVVMAETTALGSAAIVGWRKPLLLLPKGWRAWTTEERQAVLSHELAHIRRSDFLATAVGQLAVVVNFYHPLAHIVLQRLRLDQELAADSLAAQVVGGQQRYVEILAGLALRQSKVRTPGPCQAFLPPRRMFVRRLEMLRNLPNSTRWLNRCYSAVATLSLIGIAMLATGLRPHLVLAQDAAETVDAAAQDILVGDRGDSSLRSLASYLPSGLVEAVAVVDVQALLNSPSLRAVLKQADLPKETNIQGYKIAVQDVEQVAIALFMPTPDAAARDPLLIVRSKNDFSSENLNPQIRLLDSKTLAVYSNAEILNLLAIGGGDRELQDLLQQNAQAHVRLASKTNWMQMIAAQDGPGGPSLVLAPLWSKVTTLAAGISIGDGLRLNAQLDTTDPQRVTETLTAVKWLAGNYLEGIPKLVQEQSGNNPMQMVMATSAAEAGRQLLDSLDIQVTDKQVKLTATLPGAVYPMIGMAIPALASAQTAALRTQSTNNVKQLMLALHNYHDAYRHLPAAVIVDERSGAKRSWRVELLPFLEEAELYNQYRKDQPWDSQANLRVLRQMPQVFAVAGAKGTQETPYQAIVSENGGLTLTKDGRPPKFSDFLDGLSNTAILVETTQLVPWTKPVDLAVTDATPSLGTSRKADAGIIIGMADGSVRFISNAIDASVWQALITRDGGETVQLP